MPTLYLSDQYSLVRKDGECLLVEPPKKDSNGEKVKVPLIKVDDVLILGEITLTSGAVHALLENRVGVSFLSRRGDFLGHLGSGFSKNSLLRIAQFKAHLDEDVRLAIARKFVQGKLTNLRVSLMRYQRKLKHPELAQAIKQLEAMLRLAAKSRSLDVLMGCEGAGTAAYFGVFGLLLQGDWSFPGRHKRPPTDPVNALLSYGYTVLTGKISSALQAVGFDPYVGYLHSVHYGRPALALDLMEEFRPLVVDSVVITCINTGALRPEDLTEEVGSWRLTQQGRRTFITRLEERLDTEVQHPAFKYKATYRRCLELQARLLAKWLMGEIPEYPPFVVR